MLRPRPEDFHHPFDVDRPEAVRLDADVEAAAVGRPVERAVDMAEEMAGAADGVGPVAHRIVEHDEAPAVPFQLADHVDADEEIAAERHRLVVVIALDEVDAAVEAADVLVGIGRVAMGEVAEMVDEIVRADRVVPVGDEGRVHLLEAAERPLADADDVRIAEMGVGGKEDTLPGHGCRLISRFDDMRGS